MRTNILLFFILVLSVSCRDVGEISPYQRIEGNYTYAFEVTSWGGTAYILENKFSFKADGTFSREDLTFDAETNEVLGYSSIYSGTYSFSDMNLIVNYSDPLIMALTDIYYMPKEGLEVMEGNFTDTYSISDDFSRLIYICPSTPYCGPDRPFLKETP